MESQELPVELRPTSGFRALPKLHLDTSVTSGRDRHVTFTVPEVHNLHLLNEQEVTDVVHDRSVLDFCVYVFFLFLVFGSLTLDCVIVRSTFSFAVLKEWCYPSPLESEFYIDTVCIILIQD